MKKIIICLLLCFFLIGSFAYAIDPNQEKAGNFISFLIKNILGVTGYSSADDTIAPIQENNIPAGSCTKQNEECNGIDDDCDGIIDEIEIQCGDSDVGACEYGEKICRNGAWSACIGIIGPDIEVCDGEDNDCNGIIDEELIQECGSNKGICHKGEQTCVNGEWSSCSEKYIAPREEMCNGVDDNCDGKIDENEECSCTDGETRECSSNVGACSAGIQTCNNNRYGECLGAVSPQSEICDGEDNDCDGEIDEDLKRLCGESDIGVCNYGEEVCANGQWSQCIGSILPSLENCNNLDDDCDGQTDESLAKACGTDLGLCKQGYNICEKGIWSQCNDIVIEENEKCDALDNDCDGQVDEGGICSIIIPENKKNEYSSIRCICKDGDKDKGHGNDCDFYDEENPGNSNPREMLEEHCQKGREQACKKLDSLAIECLEGDFNDNSITCKCNDGDKDKGHGNDCDFYDEENPGNSNPREKLESRCYDKGIASACKRLSQLLDTCFDECISGSTKECQSDIGMCSPGKMTCTDGEWSECIGAISSQSEICNNIDDDCDGIIDEDISRDCGNEEGICQKGKEYCSNGQWSECIDQIIPKEEICNNIDDDCDGSVDENITQDCGSDIGECSKGKQECINGVFNQCDSILPTQEICDGSDQDCDGLNDNGLICSCENGDTRACGTDEGACSPGTQVCIGSTWGKCENMIIQSIEVCDGIDNDCDGIIDEDIREICGSTDIGACEYGYKTCQNGTMSACIGDIGPTDETCNRLDDNCDGFTDESLYEVCGDSDIGECSYGYMTCENGNWSLCIDEKKPADEICDALDNNCNNEIDEGLTCDKKYEEKTTITEETVKQEYQKKSKGTSSEKLGLNVKIVKTPIWVDINDGKFQVEAIVENIGQDKLHQIIVSPKITEGFSTKDLNIGDLEVEQKKGIIIEIESDICTRDTTDSIFKEENVTIDISAISSEGAKDAEGKEIPLNIPLFSLLNAPNDYSQSNVLHVCLLINNLKNDAKRHELESEIQIYDNKADLVVDFISPIKVDEDQMFIKTADYYLAYVPRAKEYTVEAKLLENGSVFTEGYIVAEDKKIVDLSQIKEEKATWTMIKEKFKSWIMKNNEKSNVLRAFE